MNASEKRRLATAADEAWSAFDQALIFGSKRQYPRAEFARFFAAARTYIEAIKSDRLVDRRIAGYLAGLPELLKALRPATPGEILFDADRLHCLLFRGYDPYFEGDEPPGL